MRVANWFDFHSKPETRKMDDKNVPAALVEIVAPTATLGTWVVPGWAGDEVMSSFVLGSFRQMGPKMAETIYGHLTEPQVIQANGKTYTMVMRPTRHYQDYAMTLLKRGTPSTWERILRKTSGAACELWNLGKTQEDRVRGRDLHEQSAALRRRDLLPIPDE